MQLCHLDHLGLPWEHFLHQEAVHLGIGVGAGVGEDEGVDAAPAQLLVEVGGEERPDPGLADDDVPGFGSDPRVPISVPGSSAWMNSRGIALARASARAD